MHYFALQNSLIQSLKAIPGLLHVAAHTLPEPTLVAYQLAGLPAALVRLLGARYVPLPDATQAYTGLAQVEITIKAAPALSNEGFADLADQIRQAAVLADPVTATLVSEASLPGPLLEYRFVFSYKVQQTIGG